MTSWETANALGHKSAQQLFKDFKHVRVAPGYASTTINRFFFFIALQSILNLPRRDV
jgi:hypothetical protein